MTYNEKSKAFETTWRTDTEHLEGVLTAFGKQEIHLENGTIDDQYELISEYIDAHTTLYLNKKKQATSNLCSRGNLCRNDRTF